MAELARVTVLKAGEFRDVGINPVYQSKGLLHAGLTGAGGFVWSNGVFHFQQPMARSKIPQFSYGNRSNLPQWWTREGSASMPSLWLMATNRQVLEDLKIRAKDTRGRIYPDFRAGDTASQENDIYFRTAIFDIPDDAGEVTFETVLTTATNRFEFYVKPPDEPSVPAKR